MDLLTHIHSNTPLLLDGAMGTQLSERGLDPGGHNNLSHPDEVIAVHRAYLDAGCHAILTNTLTMNRIYIESHRVGVDVLAVNRAGVELARQAVGDAFVLGNLSATGQMLEPYGTYSEDQFYAAFRQQAEALAGVDGYIIETMMSLQEALCALKACKDVAGIPTIACIAFTTEANGGRTIMGDAAEDCALALSDAGADAGGANCGDLDPSQMAEVIRLMRNASTLPLVAEPNAGRPQLVAGETVFDMAAEPFAEGLADCVGAGARAAGGCCGTTPAHILATSKKLGVA